MRRYAHALTGAKPLGDQIAYKALEEILADRSQFETSLAPKTALFKSFHAVWTPDLAPREAMGDGFTVTLKEELLQIAPAARAAVLLKFIGAFPTSQIAEILGVSEHEAGQLAADGTAQMRLAIARDLKAAKSRNTTELSSEKKLSKSGT